MREFASILGTITNVIAKMGSKANTATEKLICVLTQTVCQFVKMELFVEPKVSIKFFAFALMDFTVGTVNTPTKLKLQPKCITKLTLQKIQIAIRMILSTQKRLRSKISKLTSKQKLHGRT